MTMKHMSSRHTPKRWGIKRAHKKEKTVYTINESTYMHTHAYTYTYIYTPTYTHIYKHAHVHIYTDIHIYKVGIRGGVGIHDL